MAYGQTGNYTTYVYAYEVQGAFSPAIYQSGTTPSATLSFTISTDNASLGSNGNPINSTIIKNSYVYFYVGTTNVDPTTFIPGAVTVSGTDTSGNAVTAYVLGSNQTAGYTSSYNNGVGTINITLSAGGASITENLVATLYFDDGTTAVSCPATLSYLSEQVLSINYQTIGAPPGSKDAPNYLVVDGNPIYITFTSTLPVAADATNFVTLTPLDTTFAAQTIYFNQSGSTLSTIGTNQYSFTTPPLVASLYVSATNYQAQFADSFAQLQLTLNSSYEVGPYNLIALFAPAVQTLSNITQANLMGLSSDPYDATKPATNTVTTGAVQWLNFLNYYDDNSSNITGITGLNASALQKGLSSVLNNVTGASSTLSIVPVANVYYISGVPSGTCTYQSTAGTSYIPYYDASNPSTMPSSCSQPTTIVGQYNAGGNLYGLISTMLNTTNSVPLSFFNINNVGSSAFYNVVWSYQVSLGTAFPTAQVTPPTPIWPSAAPDASASVPANLANYCFAVNLASANTSPIPAQPTLALPYIDGSKAVSVISTNASFAITPNGWSLASNTALYLIPTTTSLLSLFFEITSDQAGQTPVGGDPINLLPWIVGQFITTTTTALGTGYDISGAMAQYVKTVPGGSLTDGTQYYISLLIDFFIGTQPTTPQTFAFYYTGAPTANITLLPSEPTP